MQVFLLDGNKICDLDSFYDEVERNLCPNINFQFGRNLDAFNDILYGGFGTFEEEEHIKIIFLNSKQIEEAIGTAKFEMVMDTIKDHLHIDLELH